MFFIWEIFFEKIEYSNFVNFKLENVIAKLRLNSTQLNSN